MKKFYTIIAALLMSISGVMAETITWESKSGWEQASGGKAGLNWFGAKTPGSTTTEFTLTELQIMHEIKQNDNQNCYIAIATSNSTSELSTSDVIAVSNNKILPTEVKLYTYTFTTNVTLQGGTTYYIVFLTSNTANNGKYPVGQGRVALNHQDYGAYAPGCSYSGGASWWPYYKATLTTSVAMINVTYELYESDGTTLVNSTAVQQEQGSAVSIPSSLTSNTYYDYVTEGSIGTSDCTIKVTRTLKSGIVYPYTNLSNNKSYYIKTRNNARYELSTYTDNGTTYLAAVVKSSLNISAKKFAILKYENNYYLYSVSDAKFVTFDGVANTKAALADVITGTSDRVAFSEATAPLYELRFDNSASKIFNASNSSSYPYGMVFNSWGSASSQWDDGCLYTIEEAETFDPTAALAVLEEFFHPTYKVTYIVKDGNNNVLFTSEPVATTNGATITTLPAEYQKSAFYTYNTVNVTISNSGNTNVEFTATPKAEAPVKYTADATNPYYYNLKIRSMYLVYDDEAIGDVTLQNESEAFNADASWAFIGNPYGFKVINKTKGTDYFLTYTSVVTGGNGGHADGTNNNVQFVASADFNNRYWFIDTNNNGGFVLRMVENPSIYFHHQSVSGNNGYLRTCSLTEWSNVHNDAGSTIVASTDEDVLVDLYNAMKDFTFGTEIGQYNTTDASVVTNDQATSTLAGVGAAIASSQTAAYADCYNALITLANNISLVTPSAGFYRVKNVATGKYLYGTAASTYNSTDKYVFANGDNSSVATVIQLVENNGHLYMRNQGYEFGWVAQSSTNSGGVGYLRSPAFDKYVNWLPGSAAGQIAFAICFGNGAGNYASYLTQGIYAVDTQDNSVVRGLDYTAPSAQWIFEEVTSATVALNAIGSSYYATLCVPFAYTVRGATAYKLALNGTGTALTMTEVENGAVAAGTPVMLVGSSNAATLTIGSDYAATPVTTTALTGQYLAGSVSAANNYFLGYLNDEPGFYKYSGGETLSLGANRAYYHAAAPSNGFKLVFDDDDVTAIASAINGQMVNGQYFDLQGRKVQNPVKGQIYILNGKKVLF